MPGPVNARSVVVRETESAHGPSVSTMHRTLARRREDAAQLTTESEYVQAMRMINLLIRRTHPGFKMTVKELMA